jgi:ribosomal protein L7Ae-like RNA K-turn-binding protein
LSQKARKLVSGDASVHRLIVEGKVQLLIFASDCGTSAKRKFETIAHDYNLQTVTFADKETLGKMIGKPARSIAAITDLGIANLIINKLNGK